MNPNKVKPVTEVATTIIMIRIVVRFSFRSLNYQVNAGKLFISIVSPWCKCRHISQVFGFVNIKVDFGSEKWQGRLVCVVIRN